jgi:hypothetical protein
MHLYGPRAYFASLGTLTGALTVYDLWRKTRRAAVPRELKGPFINTQQIVTCAGLESPPVRRAEATRAEAPSSGALAEPLPRSRASRS